MTEYVVGFMLSTDGENVALIRKQRPAWQKGRLNGIGGHIEDGELPIQAMVREFKEETADSTDIAQWIPFAVLSGNDWKVHFFFTWGHLEALQTVTGEGIEILPVEGVTVDNDCLPNLTWLIPMAKSMEYERATIFHIQEG